MPMPYTPPGRQTGVAGDFKIDLPLYSDMLLAAFPEHDNLPKIGLHKTIESGPSYRFPILGRTTASRFTDGDNLSVPGEGAQKAKKYENQYRDIEVDDTQIFHRTNFLKSHMKKYMDPMAYMQAVADDQARAIATIDELDWLFTGIAAAMHTNDIAITGDNLTIQKEATAGKAQLSDTTSNKYGYNINTALTSGAAVAAELFRWHNYAQFGRNPRRGRWMFVGTRFFTMLVSDFGLPVSTYGAGGGTLNGVVPALSTQVKGGSEGSYSEVQITRFAGFNIVEIPWYTGVATSGFGTELETYHKVTAPTTPDELKYQPNALTAAGFPMFKYQPSVQNTVQIGLAGGQPNAWTEFRDLLDKIAMSWIHESAVAVVDLWGLEAEGGQYDMDIQGTPMQVTRMRGMGILRPEAAGYTATAYATTA